MAEEVAKTGTRDKIVEKAKELAIKYKDSTYQMGGQSTSSFDCSYFVYLVMKEVFPDYTYANSVLIASTPMTFVKSTGKPGDIILFPKGQVSYAVKKGDKREYPNHVGIVLDSMSWVGRQSSSLGVVNFSNAWWSSRTPEYFAYFKIDAAVARASGSNLRQYFA